jgi:hypothetical protein
VNEDYLRQRDVTGGPRATAGLRPPATRAVKLFVNMLLVTIRLFIFFVLMD